jgi:hypothetical protein
LRSQVWGRTWVAANRTWFKTGDLTGQSCITLDFATAQLAIVGKSDDGDDDIEENEDGEEEEDDDESTHGRTSFSSCCG